MKTAKSRLVILAAGIFGASASVADFDGSDPLLCSFGQVLECEAVEQCRAVSNESVDAPDFVKLDFASKQIVSTTAGEDSPPGDINTVSNLTNYLVVQGVQDGSNNDTLAWSMSISHDTGQLVVTGSGEKAGFVVFGACVPM